VQRRGTAGNTTASRIKSLFLHVQETRGRASADAFVIETKLGREFLEDETRPLPLELWHGALVAFASRWGREEVAKTASAVVHPENLGVWARVLRGASDPVSAFRQLAQYGGTKCSPSTGIRCMPSPACGGGGFRCGTIR
jgi:hypothetical protein